MDLSFDKDIPEFNAGGEEMLMKAMMAGTGVDAAQMTGGRALQPEDCEATMVNAMREQMDDFKLMNTLKKTPVKSTVHQYNVRSNVGDEDSGFVGEGDIAPEEDQDIKRAYKEMKFIQKYREVTEQAATVDTFEPAYESEKIAGTLSVLRTAEKACFHGDSVVVPKEFDGLLAQVRRTELPKRNVVDLHGRNIQAAGETIFTEMAMKIADKGGAANKVFYPLILGDDIQALCKDRLRFGQEDNRMTAVWKTYPTLYGELSIAGEGSGPDKMFRPKNIIKAGGNESKLPNPAKSVTVRAAANNKSLFKEQKDAGNYKYSVHMVNEHGISTGVDSDSIVVAVGEAVEITITPAELKSGTGIIISRSAPNGDVVMEMVRIGIDTLNAQTVYVDLNEELPGTAEMLFLTEKKLQVVTEFLQLLPLRLFRMYPTNRLVTPFILALWGTPILKVPHWCGVVKNIGYKGGLYA
jgi:hypothetical protein